MTPKEFLAVCVTAAKDAMHPFPEYAACEAALESNWGNSVLAKQGMNLFGQKQSIKPVYETLELPTKEFLNGQWVTVTAKWVKFPDWKTSFEHRMKLLYRLRTVYPHYDAALKAKTGEQFVREVSQTWSTDPKRADKVLDIYAKYFGGNATPPTGNIVMNQ